EKPAEKPAAPAPAAPAATKPADAAGAQSAGAKPPAEPTKPAVAAAPPAASAKPAGNLQGTKLTILAGEWFVPDTNKMLDDMVADLGKQTGMEAKVERPGQQMTAKIATIIESGAARSTNCRVLWAFGGKEFEKDGKTVALESDGTLQSIEWWVQIFKYMDPGVTAWLDPDNNQAFLAGKVSATTNVNTIYLAAR